MVVEWTNGLERDKSNKEKDKGTKRHPLSKKMKPVKNKVEVKAILFSTFQLLPEINKDVQFSVVALGEGRELFWARFKDKAARKYPSSYFQFR